MSFNIVRNVKQIVDCHVMQTIVKGFNYYIIITYMQELLMKESYKVLFIRDVMCYLCVVYVEFRRWVIVCLVKRRLIEWVKSTKQQMF